MKITGKVLFANEETAAAFLAELEKSIKENRYHPKQAFSWNETRLFECTMPNRTYIHKSEKKRHKTQKDRWFLCSNAAGHLVKPVHRVRNPCALKNKTKITCHIWQYNQKVWVLVILFLEWFHQYIRRRRR